MLLNICSKLGFASLKKVSFIICFVAVWLCCSTFPSFPDARKLHIEGAKWKVNCLSISIMHVEKGGDGPKVLICWKLAKI